MRQDLLPAVTSAALRREREKKRENDEVWVGGTQQRRDRIWGGPAISDRSPDGDGMREREKDW